MAWASSGSTNAELASRLKSNDVIRSAVVERAFRLVDRGLFVPSDAIDAPPYADTPVRVGKVHMSAPHMYASVLEALDLSPGLSFCNIGSGAGYLSSLVSTIIGSTGVSHGIELEEEVANHARKCVKTFLEKHNSNSSKDGDSTEMKVDPIPVCTSEFVVGNCFDLDTETSLKYDRVYIGAACELKWKEFFCGLLNLGGVLVGPFGNNLIKLVKKSDKEFSTHTLARVQFAPLIAADPKSKSRGLVQLPSLIWSPETHRKFPPHFKQGVTTVLLMERQKDREGNPTGLPAMLPKHLWFHILTFASRDWFTIPLTREQFLEKLLAQEIKAREEAERRAVKAEDARDRLMMAMYLRVQFGANHNHGDDDDDDDEMEVGHFPDLLGRGNGNGNGAGRARGTANTSSSTSSSSSPSDSSSSTSSTSSPTLRTSPSDDNMTV